MTSLATSPNYAMMAIFRIHTNGTWTPHSVIFRGTTRQQIVDAWGETLHAFYRVDHTVSSICHPIHVYA
jgi:hypothetical protein